MCFLIIKKVGKDDSKYQTGRRKEQNKEFKMEGREKETVGTKMDFLHDFHHL